MTCPSDKEPTMSDEKRCGNCRWWEYRGSTLLPTPDGAAPHDLGECCHTDGQYNAGYVTANTIACPHHEPKKEAR